MKLFSSWGKIPPIYNICAPLMMEGAALPLEMRAALLLPSHPHSSQDWTCTGCVEGIHNVLCGPKAKAEAAEINSLPCAEEGARVLKPSGISGVKSWCWCLGIFGSKSNYAKGLDLLGYVEIGVYFHIFSKGLLNLRLPSYKRRMLNAKEVPVTFAVRSWVVVSFRVLARRIASAS